MTFDFRPTKTPLGDPVVTVFEVHGNVYVCDIYGILFTIQTVGDDPDFWCWMEVMHL